MGHTRFATQVSIIFGLLLFIFGAWFLITIDIHGNTFDPGRKSEWIVERRIRLQWGAAAAIGISVGIFQVAYAILYIVGNWREQQVSQIWNLTAVILHAVFLLGIFYSLGLGVNGLVKSFGLSHLAFFIGEIFETVFLVVYLIVFERECGLFRTICQFFTCDEVKLKLSQYSVPNFRVTTPNIRRERLVEETSFPI